MWVIIISLLMKCQWHAVTNNGGMIVVVVVDMVTMIITDGHGNTYKCRLPARTITARRLAATVIIVGRAWADPRMRIVIWCGVGFVDTMPLSTRRTRLTTPNGVSVIFG